MKARRSLAELTGCASGPAALAPSQRSATEIRASAAEIRAAAQEARREHEIRMAQSRRDQEAWREQLDRRHEAWLRDTDQVIDGMRADNARQRQRYEHERTMREFHWHMDDIMRQIQNIRIAPRTGGSS